MSFFSEERSAELRELFFESAQELLQALNEEGLELEKRPADAEIIRTVRRTVHTLKGDSAACGFRELSDLAHELEDVLTPEIAARGGDSAAQVVLSAADTFDAMLAAYRGNLQPPDGAPLRQLIRGLAEAPAPQAARVFAPQFAWNEYELLVAQQAGNKARRFNVGIEIDPLCPMRAPAVQLVRNVLQEAGRLLLVHPEDPAAQPDFFEAMIASDHDEQWIASKCRIPSIVSNVVVLPFAGSVPLAPEAQPSPSAPASAGADGEQPRVEPAQPAAADADGAAEPAAAAVSASTAPEGAAQAHTVSENILRVDAERIDVVLSQVGELIIGKSMLHQAIAEFMRRFPKDPLRGRFGDLLAREAQILNELQRSVMKIRMVPVEQLFRRFPRVVRDIAKLKGKEVVLEVAGQDTDLDKSILDALAEPMSHLVRNAVDHGIETTAERLVAGKPAQGTVRLNAYHQGNQVVIEVSDDGRGIDRQRVAAKALEIGLVTQESLAGMSDSEVLELIFEPGFSTAESVTQVSGRGVGLDVVKAVLERMKATVSVQSRAGEGTTFQLKVPLTLAIIKALLFRAGGRMYAVPLASVLEITRAREADIHRVDNHEVLQLRGQVLTLARLSHLGIHAEPRDSNKVFVIVVALAGRKFGLVVDRLVGEQELVIKALDDQLVASTLVSGASILGDGAVVLIINVAAAVEKFARVRGVFVEAGMGELPDEDRLRGAQA